ncbi:MAG: glutathione synthase [Thiohalomonadales bacterium]
MDPIGSIKSSKDSSFAMLLAAQKRGWKLFFMQQTDVWLDNSVPKGVMRSLVVYDDNKHWFDLAEPEVQPLDILQVILMRKDPPVDAHYITCTQILDFAEKLGVLVVNKPQSLRDANEKLFALEFAACIPPTVVTADPNSVKAFIAQHQDIIVKPLDAMGGQSIFRIREGDSNTNVILETLTQNGSELMMAQRFIPEIADGDKRILLIDGRPIPYALARIPAAGENRGNIAAGGSGVGVPLSKNDLKICKIVAPLLREKGLLFVGIDVIGDFLTEINVTSPTCIRELDRQYGLDIAGDLIDVIEKRLNQRNRD